jgi:hypothetical protein
MSICKDSKMPRNEGNPDSIGTDGRFPTASNGLQYFLEGVKGLIRSAPVNPIDSVV